MQNTQKITIDFVADMPTQRVPVKQWDKNSRIIQAEILNNGLPVTIESGTTVTYALRKPDKTQVVNTATYQNNIVTITLSDQCLTVPGLADCELIFAKNSQVLSTAVFEIEVYQSAYDDDAIESSDDYGIITSMLDDITKAMENAQNAATQADESAKKAQDAADAAAETDIGQVLNKFSDYVPTARKINGYSLSSNITLTPEDLKNEPWKSTKTTTDNGWTIRYQKSGYRRALIQVYKTLQAADTPLSNQIACYVPAALKPVNTQYLTVRAVNGSALIDMGTAELKGDNGLYLFCKKSSTAAEYIAYGEILLAEDLGDES